MSANTTNDAAQEARPRALAAVHLNNILNDQGTSSEDEVAGPQQALLDDIPRVVGVSIGYEQTRFSSPRTPATERAAAIESIGGIYGDINTSASFTSEGPKSSRHTSEITFPSPWSADQTEGPNANRFKPRLRDGIPFARHRASSGPESIPSRWHRALMSSLPSMPKRWSPFASTVSSTSLDDARDAGSTKRSSLQMPTFDCDIKPNQPANALVTDAPDTRPSREALADIDRAHTVAGEVPGKFQPNSPRSRPLHLRRSTSDTSLVLQRTLSRVPSLGDDSRFDHVQEQVNSRLKAIRDSWQDADFGLPRIRSIANFKSDFLRERSSSQSREREKGSAQDLSGGADVQSETPQDPITMQPYSSVKQAMADASSAKPAVKYPSFNRALEQLEGDIVILGGYRGSILRSAEPPHRQLWVPIKVGLNLRKVDLELGLQEDDDARATEKIIPGGMLSHLASVDISRRLFKRLRKCDNAREGRLRVHDYGYDWRLHPLHLSKQLLEFVERLPSNQAGVATDKRGVVVIAHSLGGLIARHSINRRPDLFAGVVYAGVPQTCVNILGPMRNGDDVLLSSRVLTAQVNFTVRTSFALLPLDGHCFFDRNTKDEYPVDFFDPQTWVDYRLSPCVGRPLPPLTAPAKPSGITGYVSSVTNALPSLPGRKTGTERLKDAVDSTKTASAASLTEPDIMATNAERNDLVNATSDSTDFATSIGTVVTIPRDAAVAYLSRTLATVKKFKQELAFVPAHAVNNAYPPLAVIYGKSIPTVYGARVTGREGIKRADAYDELAFASGDGVVLARASMVPQGYVTARGGVVSSERGHVTLLGDLEAVGKCLNSLLEARRRGIGLGGIK